MKSLEIVILILGIVLFLFAMVLIYQNHKKERSITKNIWLLLLAFAMMSLSVMAEMDLFGLLTFKKQEKVADIEKLTKALDICPENEVLRAELVSKLTEVEELGELEEHPKDAATIADAYIALHEEDKAIEISNKVLNADTGNKKVKEIKDYAVLMKELDELPEELEGEDLVTFEQKVAKTKTTKATLSKEQLNRLDKKYLETKKRMEAK